MKNLLYIGLILLFSACRTDVKKDNATEKNPVRKTEEVLEQFPNGMKKLEGTKVNGKRHGIWKAYYDNGFLWSEGKFWPGKRKGFSTVYHKNGKKKMEGHYKENLKVGVWKLWGEDGALFKTINMDELLTKEDSLKLKLQ